MKIATDTLAILSAIETDGPNAKITAQLDRKTYDAVNKILEHLGGKWNRKAKAHVFPSDAADILDAVIVSGEVDIETQKHMGFFPTPVELVRNMMRAAQLMPSDTVLEPSAGEGGIAAEVVGRLGPGGSLHCIELDPKRFATLEATLTATPHVGKLSLYQGDFLTQKPAPRFSVILMNPPFAKGQDIQHIRWAFNWLAPGGRLVAIASAGVLFREDKRTDDFRNWASREPQSWHHFQLPEGAFKASGTGVNTVMLVLRKEGGDVGQDDKNIPANRNVCSRFTMSATLPAPEWTLLPEDDGMATCFIGPLYLAAFESGHWVVYGQPDRPLAQNMQGQPTPGFAASKPAAVAAAKVVANQLLADLAILERQAP